MSFLKKIQAQYSVTAKDQIKYQVDVGIFDHSGKSSAEWQSFKTAKGVLSDPVTADIQKIAYKFFSVFKAKKLVVDPKSCRISVDNTVLDFIFFPKDKTKDIYAQITFIFERDGRELNVKDVLSKKDLKELESKLRALNSNQ